MSDERQKRDQLGGRWTRLADGRLRIHAWCACGATVKTTAYPPDVAVDMLRLFREAHQDEECGRATPETARNARRVCG